ASLTTGPNGRFRLTGVGRDRVVDLGFEGPGIQSGSIAAMTRPGTVATPAGKEGGSITILGARFDHLVAPGRSIVGFVRDKATREPLAGATVVGEGTNTRTATGPDGRFSLAGFPKGK